MPDPANPTLRALLGRPDLALALLSSEDDLAEGALRREVRWVHSTDLADPTPFLWDGLALLTTGRQFPDAAEAPSIAQQYVQRLVSRGVVGLGFGTGVVHDTVPTALIDACRDAGMPLFEVPYRTPFIAVARANAEAIAARAYSRRTWALGAQRAVSLAALRADGLGATIAELSRQLDAWVGLFDGVGELSHEFPHGGLSRVSAAAVHEEVAKLVRRGARAASSFPLPDASFSLQTLGHGGHLRGVIAVSESALDQESRAVLTTVVALADLALEQRDRIATARSALRAGLMESLRAGDAGLAHAVSAKVWGPLPSAPLLVALTGAADAESEVTAELLEMRANVTHGGVFYGTIDAGLVLIISASESAALPEIAARLHGRIGVSDQTDYNGIAAAIEQARIARDRGSGTVARFSQVARTGILSALNHDARSVAAAELASLVTHDSEHGTALIDTVRVWFEQDCSHEACARALGVHRHTVRARLALTERILGRDLASFATRAELWTALQLTR